MIILAVAASLSGCFSLERTPLSNEVVQTIRLPDGKVAAEHVVASNFGWYFFNRFPIVCGNAKLNSRWSWVFFRNDVSENVLQKRFMDYAAARDSDVMELNIFNNEEALMTIGVGGLSIPLPYIITFRELQYSGVLVKNGAKAPPEEPAATPPTPEAPGTERQKLNTEMKNLLDRIPDGGSL